MLSSSPLPAYDSRLTCMDQPGRAEYEEAMEFAAQQERERLACHQAADDWVEFWAEVRAISQKRESEPGTMYGPFPAH